jgi:hypothetical protein
MKKFLARTPGTFLGGDESMLVLQTSDFLTNGEKHDLKVPKIKMGQFDIVILPEILSRSENNLVIDFIKSVDDASCKIIYV